MRTLGRRIVFRRKRNVRSKQDFCKLYLLRTFCFAKYNPHPASPGAPFKRGLLGANLRPYSLLQMALAAWTPEAPA